MVKFRHYKPRSLQICSRERKKYDAFLSFRGPDVKKTLVDHLYQSLFPAGVNVFIDSEKLEKGQNIGTNLEQAIQDSTIYIPIFSPDYSTSEWCLKEVSLMWKLKSTSTYPIVMIPLFYNVEPCEVRYAEWIGPYAEAFTKHRTKGRHSEGEIEGWSDALNRVSCLSGWSLKETSFGFEGRLVKQVVKDVLQTLDIGVLDVAIRPVGLIPRCDEVIKLLKLGDKTSDKFTLGVWGMGGLGKTTLSKALYNKIHHFFEASSFVSNVKSESSIRGLRKLQQQIFRDLLKTQVKVDNIDHGKVPMRNRLASLRALVVLDDIDNVQQLDALMGDWFGNGSRIIITTRDKRVLEVRQVDLTYPMRGLELAEGVELFSWHAFLRAHPQRGYEDITESIVKSCSGLPLCLEIIGTDLYNRNHIAYWTEALRKLENVGHNSVLETLKISYDTLTHVEKHIFLDIACFFVNLKSSIFIQNRAFNMEFYDRFWTSLGYEPVYTSLKTLEEKALIVVHKHRYSEAIDEDIDEGDHSGQYFCEFSMHELIRDMGRRIVVEEWEKDPAKRSRVWREEDISTLMASTTIQVLFILCSTLHSNKLFCKFFVQFSNLKAKMMHLVLLTRYGLGQDVLRSRNLKRIGPNVENAHGASAYRYFGTNAEISFLDVLEIPINMAVQETAGDRNGSSVRSSVLPKSVAQLIYLRYLDMSGTKQTCLPKEVCELHCLEELCLSRCSLEALPEAFGNLINLKTLDVSNNFLLEFPPSFQHLQSLRNLEMDWNEQLVAFPSLPNNLIALSARRCSKLQVISLDIMRSLETIDLSHCKSVTRLPELESCISLRNLNVDGCKQFVKLDALPQRLASLRISGCSQLQDFPFIHQRRDVVPAFARSHMSGARTESFGGNEVQSLCMIGCDRIRLNIY
ncbi:disease resistance protein Roq1-like [Cryptomeria japonica]|uniref:disease resistance protein Roq1-like n=1 Tax=Cryptomeria japonica TaxID=3369 RepID=UPI0027DAA94D|nr:disease resistance protein Roq1-like [Cryptomeria japonica]